MSGNLGRWTHFVLRVGTGLLFLEHGLQKLFGTLGGFGAPGGTVPLVSQLGAAGVLELFGGGLLMLGLFTRPVAGLLLMEMLVAFFQMHMPQGGWPIQNQGELALLYALIFLYLVGHGAGMLSADSWIFANGIGERRHAMMERRTRRAPAFTPVHG